jgi:methionyl-tRNA formyltransferase
MNVKIYQMTPRIVFMGSPELARVILAKVASQYTVYCVVTQPDRPAGRGKQLTPPPVKVLAEELGCKIMQPERLRLPENFEILKEWAPDIILVAAYGQILRQNVLDLPPLGCVNVHASLLPRWRGAAPIQAAILNGDTITGVCIMKMDAGSDTGAVYSRREIAMEDSDDALTLTGKLADAGGELLLDTLPSILNGTAKAVDQPEEGATYASMLKKEDGLLDFSKPARELFNRVRAFYPWPGTFFTWDNQPLKVIKARPVYNLNGIPGSRSIHTGYPVVFCTEGALLLEEVQPSGKKPMDGKVFLNGARNWDKG